MSQLNFEFIPLTFISDSQEIEKQIRHTLILIYLFEKFNQPTRLQNLLESTQYGYIASAQPTGRNKFLRISDIQEGKVNWETVPFCDCDDEDTYVLQENDILVARTGGTTGKTFKIRTPASGAVFAGYLIRLRAKQSVNSDYVHLFLNSYAYWSQIVNLNERNFRPKANAENLKSLVIPNCPKQVQDDVVNLSKGRSVDGYELLSERIDQVLLDYKKTQQLTSLIENQLALTTQLQQAILQDAVQGKLTRKHRESERAETETGADLLARIRAEKAALVAAKKLKKEKILPPITDTEKPFDLPDNWVWARLGEVCGKISTGPFGTMLHQSDYEIGGTPLINPMHIINGQIVPSEKVTVGPDTKKRLGSYLLNRGDIVVGRRGEMGRCAIVTEKEDGWLCGTGSFFLTLNETMSGEYFVRFLRSEYAKSILLGASVGSTMTNLNHKILSNLPIPLPPLAEQRAIVSAVERALGQVGALRAELAAQRQTANELLRALLHRAFGMDADVVTETHEQAVPA